MHTLKKIIPLLRIHVTDIMAPKYKHLQSCSLQYCLLKKINDILQQKIVGLNYLKETKTTKNQPSNG